MGYDLKAENLAISIPNNGCNKNCEYCVSRMTGYIKGDYDLMLRNAPKVLTVAKAAEVTSVLFTGKGEPTFGSSYDCLRVLLDRFQEFPCELQTNGILLAENITILSQLFIHGIDVIAISMDSGGMFADYVPLFTEIARMNMVSRITVNVTDKLPNRKFKWYLDYCKDNKINQLTFRSIVAPEIVKDQKTHDWIRKNVDIQDYAYLVDTGREMSKRKGRLIRTLRNGMQIWDLEGVSLTFSDYCIQERDNGDNLRSLVFQEDGHLYTGWGSRASILF
jgi:sulfatase maturation enzyme AslB (radical SAM superfamily)